MKPSSILQKLALDEQQRIKASKEADHALETPFDFIERISKDYTRPNHFAALEPFFIKSLQKPIRLLISAPPRHGKSVTIFHYILWWMWRNPNKRVLYVGYSADFVKRQSAIMKRHAESAGYLHPRLGRNVDNWSLKNGSQVSFRGIDGAMTGLGFELIIVDDPYKNRGEAESAIVRQSIMDAWSSSILTRLEPKGSIICSHTRWHMDDLLGRLSQSSDYTYYNFPALGENDKPLWEDRYSAEYLKQLQADYPYDFASLYQGHPVPRGSSVFNDPVMLGANEEMPAFFEKVVIGIDIAYTAKTKSDYCAAVTVGVYKGRAYILDVKRERSTPTDFLRTLQSLQNTFSDYKPQFVWFASGVESGTADFFKNKGVNVRVLKATQDKFARAQEAVAAWNQGKIILPSNNPAWIGPF